MKYIVVDPYNVSNSATPLCNVNIEDCMRHLDPLRSLLCNTLTVMLFVIGRVWTSSALKMIWLICLLIARSKTALVSVLRLDKTI